MTTRLLIAACAVVVATFGGGGCGKGASSAPENQAQAQTLREPGLGTLPGETRVVIGIAVPRLAASPLARQLLGDLLARDAEAHSRITALLEHCKLDPSRDFSNVIIAMASAEELALVLHGHLDEKSLVECVRAEATSNGGSFVAKGQGSRTLYSATSKEGAQRLWFTFDAESLVVTPSETWLSKIVDPASPKLAAQPELVALLARVAPDAALWGVGLLPAGVGAELVKLTEGKVAQPATSAAFELTFDKGLAATLRFDLKTSADADKLAGFAKGQLDWLALAAQKLRLGKIVAKAAVTIEGSSVKLALKLDEVDVKTLTAVFGHEPTSAPSSNDSKKEQSK